MERRPRAAHGSGRAGGALGKRRGGVALEKSLCVCQTGKIAAIKPHTLELPAQKAFVPHKKFVERHGERQSVFNGGRDRGGGGKVR